eukprot:CAMPEP_0168863248 /NCGR_PEP_ID=MMETSP0727-20121128/18853_1 /TAXON_ID=265536 /ORGANISM="Amphiprora sp., Strain CCMP467" /LENGTH=395 /DNA_ID=CAMNT_0008918313 /DNA_START=85 /DNA_END=1268 /DNA_ORIENTATION=+
MEKKPPDDSSNEKPLEEDDKKPAARTSDDEREGAVDAWTVDAGVLERKWEEMFTRLKKYKESFGNCLVPNRFPEDPQLGSWVSTQRRQYRILQEGGTETTPMTKERARRLESIGFQWSTKDPRHVPWQQRYEELVAFQNEYGHSQVPIGWEENVQLSNWVSTQRQEYKLLQKGRSSRLTPQKIELLNKVDFIWEAQRGGPRRKRKATVMVPPKATPVTGAGPTAAKKGGHSGIRLESHLASNVSRAAQESSTQQQMHQLNHSQGTTPTSAALIAHQLQGLQAQQAMHPIILAQQYASLQPNRDLSGTSQHQLHHPLSLTAAAYGMAQAVQQQQQTQQLLQGLRALFPATLQLPLQQNTTYSATVNQRPLEARAALPQSLEPRQPDETGSNPQRQP